MPIPGLPTLSETSPRCLRAGGCKAYLAHSQAENELGMGSLFKDVGQILDKDTQPDEDMLLRIDSEAKRLRVTGNVLLREFRRMKLCEICPYRRERR